MLKFGPHRSLNRKSELLTDDEFGEFAEGLTTSMLKIMKSLQGVGLAAIQLGIPKRVLVANVGSGDIIMINPIIKSTSEEMSEFEEGCLSFPLQMFKISRPSEVTVEFRTINGSVAEETFAGIEAVVVQHEIDHLDGVTVLEKVSRLKKDIYRRKFKKFRRKIGK
jgi:peptide deformylase